MANFESSLVSVLRHEGGYVDDPDDSGGATNRGITQRTLARWRGQPVTKNQVKRLTKTEAGEIYKAKYWDKLLLDEVKSQALAEAVMDMGVNAGPRTSARYLQQAVNWVTLNASLKVDGRIGVSSLHGINVAREQDMLKKFFELRVSHYMRICRKRPSQRKFLYAWIKRSLEHAGN